MFCGCYTLQCPTVIHRDHHRSEKPIWVVQFQRNVQLGLSRLMATTMLSSFLVLCSNPAKVLPQVFSESTWLVGVRMIQGCKGVGDFPGILGGGEGLGVLQV